MQEINKKFDKNSTKNPRKRRKNQKKFKYCENFRHILQKPIKSGKYAKTHGHSTISDKKINKSYKNNEKNGQKVSKQRNKCNKSTKICIKIQKNTQNY